MLVTMKQSVNERVKLLRSSLKLTQIEFAQELKVSPSSIAKIETGEKPSIAMLDAIVEKFQTPEDWLVNGKGVLKFIKPNKNGQADPWKDEAYVLAKEQLAEKDSTIKMLSVSFDRLTKFLDRVEGNFLQVLKETGS